MKGPASKPQLLVCYLCGQQFGSSSLTIHVPQCHKKKMVEWERAEPGCRGPRPKDPSTVDLSQVSNMTKEEFNNQQFSDYSDNLAQCENCGRKFLPDRLAVHQRSCKPGNPGGGSKPVSRKEAASKVQQSSYSPQPPAPQQPQPKKLATVDPPQRMSSYNQRLGPRLRALQQILFDECDFNHDGKIDVKELRQVLHDLEGEVASEKEVSELMSSLDLNRDGVIDRNEWSAMQKQAVNPLRNRLPAGKVKEPRICAKCGVAEHDDSAIFCPDCGTKFPVSNEAAEKCRSCQANLPAGAKFCMQCGASCVKQALEAETAPKDREKQGPLECWACSNCGENCEIDSDFCDACGCAKEQEPEEPEQVVSRPQRQTQQYSSYSVPVDVVDAGTEEDSRVQCSKCGRKFNPDVIRKHEKVCQAQKSRRVFDSTKHRTQGLDIPVGQRSRTDPPPPPTKWKNQSEDFRKVMRAARETDRILKAGGTAKDLPAPTYSENSHYTPCPFCGRKFAPDVAERHIPRCKDIVNKPKAPPRRR